MVLSTSYLKHRNSFSAGIDPRCLIQPLFIVPGHKVRKPVPATPGIEHLSIDQAIQETAELQALGIGGVIPYFLQFEKDADASLATARHSPLHPVLSALRDSAQEMVIIADLCLCYFTDHGHCGVLDGELIDNDRTLKVLEQLSVTLARAGASAVMPSGMVDGAVQTTRRALDAAGFADTLIISQASKFDSALYGPFRQASRNDPFRGSKAAYQVSPANRRESLRELQRDALEGVDMLVLKPTLGFGDIFAEITTTASLPLIAYCTSGEHALFSATKESHPEALIEYLIGIRRAGASGIITYAARQVAEAVRSEK